MGTETTGANKAAIGDVPAEGSGLHLAGSPEPGRRGPLGLVGTQCWLWELCDHAGSPQVTRP